MLLSQQCMPALRSAAPEDDPRYEDSIWPTEVELKGAKLKEQGAPCFIWTLNVQQVNCLRDSEGEIIEGAVDDIRTACYAMAITRHPELDKLNLEYPWQVSELANLWNQPCH